MHNKRVLSKIDLGKYSKPNPYSKDIITDPMGQWKYPGVPTRIPSSDITMQGVGYPVLGVADTGQTQMMMPGVDYTFPGANYVDEYPQAKKGGLVKMPKPSKKGLASKKFTSSVMGTSRLFTESPLFAKPKKKKNRIFDPNAKYYQDGGEPGDRFKKRLMKRYPGMQGVYGPEGENLNIVKDPNYDAASEPYGAGNIEFMFPGLPQVSYPNKKDETLPDYVYVNPSPDKYTSVYNPRGANRADIFLDMMHGMRDDQNYEVLLQNFDKAVRDARGGDMQYFYEQAVANEGYTDSQEQYDDNYVDSQLRAQLAPGTLGMFSHGRKDYRMERKYDSPEMRQAAKDIKNYLKTPKEDYIETELTPEEIEEYRRGGFIVEDISVPQLTMQDGGEPKRKKTKFVPGTYDPTETAGYMLDEQEVVVSGKASNWGKAATAYKKRNPEQEFIDKKKRQYLKRNKGLNKLYGLSMSNFPEDVEQNFRDEYDYKKNSAVVKQVGKQEGWNPNNRTEYVDNLNDTQKGIVAESKYGSKLQPSTWNRALAGVQELGNTLLPGQPFQYNIPGLTKKEQKEMRDSKLSALEIMAPINTLGQNIANYTKNVGLSTGSDYKELPGVLSGEFMPNVTDADAMALDPIQLPLMLSGAAELPMLIGKGGKAAVKLMNTEDGSLSKVVKGYKEVPKELPGSPNSFKGLVQPEEIDSSKLARLKNILNESLSIPKELRNQVVNRQDIKKAVPVFEEELVKLTSPEGINRLKALGVDDVNDFIKYLDKAKVYTRNNMKTGIGLYDKDASYVNLNFDQLKKLPSNLLKADDYRSVQSHEIGHMIQEYLRLKGKTKNATILDEQAIEELAPFVDPTNSSSKKINYFFKNQQEPLAHLRELKQNMLNTGVIDDIHQTITSEDLSNFYINNKGYEDRIMSFIKPGEKAYSTLAKLLNKTPVVVPIALGTKVLQEEQDGGIITELTDTEIAEYKKGGWIVEEL